MCNVQWQDIGGMFVGIDDTHRFGTDAVLLENFADVKRNDIVCDIGTGCGIIPVLMCKNGRAKKIFAIEIQKDAANLALKSAERNKIDKIQIICHDACDIKKIDDDIGAGSLDVVVCNPPYYKVDGGGVCPQEKRRTCRQEDSLDIYGVCEFSKRFLRFGGKLCVCYKPQRLCDCIDAMKKNDIEPKKIRFVYTDITDSPWLVLVEGKKGAHSFVDIMPPLVMNSESGEKEIKKIYGEIREKQEK